MENKVTIVKNYIHRHLFSSLFTLFLTGVISTYAILVIVNPVLIFYPNKIAMACLIDRFQNDNYYKWWISGDKYGFIELDGGWLVGKFSPFKISVALDGKLFEIPDQIKYHDGYILIKD